MPPQSPEKGLEAVDSRRDVRGRISLGGTDGSSPDGVKHRVG
jgi:hypothetical protein